MTGKKGIERCKVKVLGEKDSPQDHKKGESLHIRQVKLEYLSKEDIICMSNIDSGQCDEYSENDFNSSSNHQDEHKLREIKENNSLDGSQITLGDKCNILVDRKVTQNAKQFVGVINGVNSTDIST